MNSDSAAPPRVDEQVPQTLREFVHGARKDNPGDAAMERMSKRLATAGVLSAVVSASEVPPRGELRSAYVLGVLVLVIAGGLVLKWGATRGGLPNGAAAPATALSVNRDATKPVTRLNESPLVERAEGPKTVAVLVDDLPSAAAPAESASASLSVGAARGTGAKPSAESTGSIPAATELELFRRAQAVLASDPQRALSITEEQARAYPSGEFVQEREVIAIEALSRLGRKDESLRRALALVHRFPRTPYVPRLEKAIGHPLWSTSYSEEPGDSK